MSPEDGSAAALVSALTEEHHRIDAGIEAFTAGLAEGRLEPEPLRSAMAALRRHIYLEEEFLFPPIRAAGLMMPIQVMLHEHGHIWRAMDRLDVLLADAAGRPDPGADLTAECGELLALLDQHNSKEEPIVYPRAESDLTEQQCAQLTEFLTDGRTPDGWVCQILEQAREADSR